MFSSAFFIVAAKLALFSRAFAHLLEKDARSTLKARLLAQLTKLGSLSYERLAVDSVSLVYGMLNFIGGKTPFSPSYFFRLFCIGGVLGLLFSFVTLGFVSTDFGQFFRVLQKAYWQNLVVMPSVLTGAIFLPLDFAIAHLIVQWASRGSALRAGIAVLLGGPVAYLTWTIGAATALNVGQLIMSGYASPAFFFDRVFATISNPLTGSAQMQLGTRWFSYSLLSAASGLTSAIVTGVFLIFSLVRAIPPKGQRILAAPIFAVLAVIRVLDARKIDLPARALVWAAVTIALILAFVFRMMGL